MAVTQKQVIQWIKSFAEAIAANKDYLTELDAAIGDADHGANMDRGFKAVMQKLPDLEDKDIGAILKSVAMTLLSTVGGASGPLYGTVFLQAGAKFAGKLEFGLADWCEALEAGVNGVMLRGKAQAGDKTMLDACLPGLQALKKAVQDEKGMPEALQLSAQAARQGMLATTPLVARKGRASYLGERSAGHQDPGATSTYLLFQAAADAWSE